MGESVIVHKPDRIAQLIGDVSDVIHRVGVVAVGFLNNITLTFNKSVLTLEIEIRKRLRFSCYSNFKNFDKKNARCVKSDSGFIKADS